MRYCKKCVTPDTRPRIEFDKKGVCNACRFAEKKAKIDWQKRNKQFARIMNKYRSKDPMKYDCLLPVSGGKDSTYVAYRIKHEYKMNPLAVTFAPNLYTEAGRKNLENFRKVVGIDHILFTANKKVLRKLARKMFVMFGDPFIPWIIGIYALPARIALNFKIPLIIYSEQGESEYGGSSERDKVDKFDRQDLEKYGRPSGFDPKKWKQPENWIELFKKREITMNDLKPYIYPKQREMDKAGIRTLYFGYYHQWSGYENYRFAKKLGFQEHEHRLEGTYQNYSSMDDKIDPLYIYMMYPKFGISRAAKDASPDIRWGRLTRKKAIRLIKKYGDEFPYRYLRECLEFLDMTEEEVFEVVEKFRNKKIWGKIKGQWRLKHPIWQGSS